MDGGRNVRLRAADARRLVSRTWSSTIPRNWPPSSQRRSAGFFFEENLRTTRAPKVTFLLVFAGVNQYWSGTLRGKQAKRRLSHDTPHDCAKRSSDHSARCSRPIPLGLRTDTRNFDCVSGQGHHAGWGNTHLPGRGQRRAHLPQRPLEHFS